MSDEQRLRALDTLVRERLARYPLPAGSEILVAPSDNGESDWLQPVHATVFLPGGEDAYGLADLGCASVSDTAEYLLEQVHETLPSQRRAA